jgi:hypothetical protein
MSTKAHRTGCGKRAVLHGWAGPGAKEHEEDVLINHEISSEVRMPDQGSPAGNQDYCMKRISKLDDKIRAWGASNPDLVEKLGGMSGGAGVLAIINGGDKKGGNDDGAGAGAGPNSQSMPSAELDMISGSKRKNESTDYGEVAKEVMHTPAHNIPGTIGSGITMAPAPAPAPSTAPANMATIPVSIATGVIGWLEEIIVPAMTPPSIS